MASLIRADDLGQDLEDKAAKEGRYDLRIVKSEYKPTKNGENKMIAAMIAIDGADGEGVLPFNHYLLEPNGDDVGVDRRRLRDIKRFLTMFGVPFDNGFDMEEQASELVGCTAQNAMVTTEDYEGTTQNRLRLPRLD